MMNRSSTNTLWYELLKQCMMTGKTLYMANGGKGACSEINRSENGIWIATEMNKK